MPDSYTRQTIRVQRSLEAPNRKAILNAYGAQQTAEVKAKVWNYSRFVYKNVRPRPTFSKSEKAWRYAVDDGAVPALILYNPVTDRRGVNYPKYVHLAGRRDLLMLEVIAVAKRYAPKVARALAYDRLQATKLVKHGA